MRERRMTGVGGIRLSYAAWGPPEAPAMVLLHATGEGADDWETVAPALAGEGAGSGAAAAPWRVYAPDLRGHGRSDRPGTYSLELMRDDLLAFLDALGLGEVVLVGHSMGGVVGYLLAQDQPERVRALVLEDVPVPRPRKPVAPVRPEGELDFDWDMVLAVRAQIDTPDPAWAGRMGRIGAPALLLAGGPASHVPQDGIREMARALPDAELADVPAGHLIHAAEPEEFVRLVRDFLARRVRGGGRP
ncbi:alpha/beta fold hydrolase [Streptomyces sp. NPDC086023]|uniref:alpha/beta fold hydrolase n=1 Tax=Streptomyces sp. NPDC086023 TaxID=3365746 RepID=UPI0037D93019